MDRETREFIISLVRGETDRMWQRIKVLSDRVDAYGSGEGADINDLTHTVAMQHGSIRREMDNINARMAEVLSKVADLKRAEVKQENVAAWHDDLKEENMRLAHELEQTRDERDRLLDFISDRLINELHSVIHKKEQGE